MCLCALIMCHGSIVASVSHAGISDRVVAFVDEQAITLSELEEQYQNTAKISPDISAGEVLNTMINKLLLLREARKYRIEASTADQVISEFIDLKIRSFIRINDADAELFFRDHANDFAGREYDDVRDEIEKYLAERELNRRLKDVLRELRAKAYIRTYLDKGR